LHRAQLESKLLASALYRSERSQLELEFRSGKRYLYFQVPELYYQELLQAPSKGAYFHRAIRNRFAFQDLSAAPSSPIVLASRITK
jgi:hypothetical protein